MHRINPLIREIRRSPFAGAGKPEPLEHGLAAYWSRRINAEHRIVYKVEGDAVLIARLRYHYEPAATGMARPAPSGAAA